MGRRRAFYTLGARKCGQQGSGEATQLGGPGEGQASTRGRRGVWQEGGNVRLSVVFYKTSTQQILD